LEITRKTFCSGPGRLFHGCVFLDKALMIGKPAARAIFMLLRDPVLMPESKKPETLAALQKEGEYLDRPDE